MNRQLCKCRTQSIEYQGVADAPQANYCHDVQGAGPNGDYLHRHHH